MLNFKASITIMSQVVCFRYISAVVVAAVLREAFGYAHQGAPWSGLESRRIGQCARYTTRRAVYSSISTRIIHPLKPPDYLRQLAAVNSPLYTLNVEFRSLIAVIFNVVSAFIRRLSTHVLFAAMHRLSI